MLTVKSISALLFAFPMAILAQNLTLKPVSPEVKLMVDQTNSLPDFESYHKIYVDYFVRSSGFGMNRMPNVQERLAEAGKFTLNGDLCTVKSIQLISLLKHDPPVAYVLAKTPEGFPKNRPLFPDHQMNSQKLPDMKKLTEVPVRPLNEFETSALAQIVAKHSDVVSEGNAKIVGAIRAQSSCLKCHEVSEGDLLGAFSYVIEKKSP